MRKKYKRKKGPVRSKKVTFDGITFASGLEKYMYLALKEAKIKGSMFFKDKAALIPAIRP